MKAWRESASLILAARHGQTYRHTALSAHNYNLLCLKRHQQVDFMAGAYVFPGGIIDPADSNLKWCELFSTFGYGNSNFTSLIPKATVRPKIFRSLQDELPREISLRITAIRETFEECGVLVCRQKDNRTSSTWAQYVSLPKDELQIWQSKVHNNAAEFFTLCERYKCYPDLWALHEWSNWLTPTYMTKRYDTAFFLACMPTIPDAEYEAVEMQDLKWETPKNLLSPSMDIALPPPQMYEITRLSEFKSIDSLLDYAMNCSKEGTQLYLPVAVHIKDGILHILPGDTMYPKEVSLTEKQIIDKSDMSLDECRKMTPKNRLELHDGVFKILQADNIHTKHIPRVADDSQESQIKNKL